MIGIVVVVIIIIAVGGYLALTIKPSSSSTSTTGPTSSTTSSTSTGYNAKNANQLTDEAIGTSYYDSLDPAYGFFTVDGFFANVFQGLVSYNYSSTTGNLSFLSVVPTIASSWTINSGFTQYNFTIRPNVWFSNKDPVDAYTVWFSFVRMLYYNAPTTVGISNYLNLSVNATTDISAQGNIFPHGLRAALVANGVPNNENSLVSALNHMLSNFNPTNATQKAIMSYPTQAYVVPNNSTFEVNLIQPYKLFLLTVCCAQWSAVMDPTYIDAHGGVSNNTALCVTSACTAVVDYFNTNGNPGTGPYEYSCPSGCPADKSSLTLVANPNYWAAGVSGLNKILQPAQISTVIMKFSVLPNTQIEDFATNNAQIVSPPFAQLGQAFSTFHSSQPRFTFNQVYANLGYPLCDLAIGLNTQLAPTNSTLLREAMVHAINYTAIQQELFSYNGTILGQNFIPPVPPGWGPLDNPANIPLYSYNITLALQLIIKAGNQAHFYVTLPNGTNVGYTAGTRLQAIPFDYIVPLTSELSTEISIIQSGLANIGVSLAATGITTGVYDSFGVSPLNWPNSVGVGWCADWADPIYQQFYDMATTVAHQPNWVNNATLNTLLAVIPFETNATLQLQQTEQAYNIFTQLASIIQIPNGVDNGAAFMVQPYVHGLVYSPFQFAFLYNLVTYSPA